MERATEHAERILNTHNPKPGWHLVTAASHPCLFDVFEAISHDAGFGAGHTNYSVPDVYTPGQIDQIETDLRGMGKELAMEFAIGGEDDRLDTAYPEVNKFLNHFFNDWEDDA